MYYVMHIPTGQFLYRIAQFFDRSKHDVSIYSEYELQRSKIARSASRIVCKDILELLEWFHCKDLGEEIRFSDTYQINRSKKYICEFTLIPIPE